MAQGERQVMGMEVVVGGKAMGQLASVSAGGNQSSIQTLQYVSAGITSQQPHASNLGRVHH
jgi:hypothetical protein